MSTKYVNSDLTTMKMDLNTLFQKYSILEIQTVVTKRRSEIERKKEDLRQMVGQRYRDVIESADTITAMNQGVSKVECRLKILEDICSSVTRGQYVELPETSFAVDIGHDDIYNRLSAMKLVVEAPDKIWTYLDRLKLLKATVWYLVSTNVNTNLRFNRVLGIERHLPTVAGDGVTLPTIQNCLVLNQQVSLIYSCINVIESSCCNTLQRKQLSTKEACDSLLSLQILLHLTTDQLLDEFLKLRLSAIQDCFTGKSSVMLTSCEVVALMVALVTDTLLLVNDLFCPKDLTESYIRSEYMRISDKERSSAWCSRLFDGYHPTLWQGFCGSDSLNEDIDRDKIRADILQWMEGVQSIVNSELPSALRYVVNVTGLAAICEAVNSLSSETFLGDISTWNNMCDTLLDYQFEPWSDLLENSFQIRCKCIVNTKVAAIFTLASNKLSDIHKSQIDSKGLRSDNNLTQFIWSEHSQTSVSSAEDLSLKVRSYNRLLQRICAVLDSEFEDLLNDVVSYLGCPVSHTDSNNNRRTEDVIRFLQHAACEEFINKLLDTINSLLNVPEGRTRCRYAFYGRLVCALNDLCPNFQRCVSGNLDRNCSGGRFRHGSGSVQNSDWAHVQNQLLDVASCIYGMWRVDLCNDIKLMCDSLFPNTKADVLKFLTSFKSIDIDETNDSGEKITSQIRVPSSVMCQLTNILIWTTNAVNAVGGHSLRRSVLAELRVGIVEVLVESYRSHITDDSWLAETMNQALALQFIFDLRFLTMLLISKDSHVCREVVKHLVARLETFVDPFDLDVFSPHVQANLKSCLQQSISLYATLSQSEAHGTGTGFSARSAAAQLDQYVVCLATCSTRFNLLPVNVSQSKPNGILTDGPKSAYLKECGAKMAPVKHPVNGVSSSSNSLIKSVGRNAIATSSTKSFFSAVTSSFGLMSQSDNT